MQELSRTTGMSNIKQSLTPNTEQCETNLTKHAKNPKPIWREIKQVEFCVKNYFGNILKLHFQLFLFWVMQCILCCIIV